MANSKSKVRIYDEGYKVEAVKLAKETSVKTASDELGVPYGTLNGWVIAAKSGKLDTGKGTQTPASAMTQAARIKEIETENKALKKEVSRLKEENEFLEEAAVFFAASSGTQALCVRNKQGRAFQIHRF